MISAKIFSFYQFRGSTSFFVNLWAEISVRGTVDLIMLKQGFNCFNFYIIHTGGDVRVTGTYLIFLPSSNDVIYFPSKNNTRLFFLLLNNDVNYYPFKINDDANYG